MYADCKETQLLAAEGTNASIYLSYFKKKCGYGD